MCCSAQIVNKGILHVSDATKVYFEDEFTNEKGSVFSNNGSAYFNQSIKNNGTIESSEGSIYYKCTIENINVSGLNDSIGLFSLSIPQNSRVTYLGKKTRAFQIHAESLLLDKKETTSANCILINKNSSGFIESDRLRNTISAKVKLATNDFIEIWSPRNIYDSITVKHKFSLSFIND
jgi:hypothetical protein